MKSELFIFKILLFILLPLSLQHASANQNLADQKYLLDIPEPTEENLRWLMTVDRWSSADEYVTKGKYLSLASRFEDNVNGRIEDFSWDAFETKDLSGKWAYSFSALDIKFSNGEQCDDPRIEFHIPGIDKYLECNFLSCELRKMNSAITKEIRPNVKENWYKFGKDKKFLGRCPLTFGFVIGDVGGKNGLNFRYRNVNLDKYIAEIDISGKSHFLNLDKCKRNMEWCDVVDIQFSRYEKDWIKLKKHQEKKDITELNDLIQYLLPCVKKRNEMCVRKYFVSKNDIIIPEGSGNYTDHAVPPSYYNFTLNLNEEMYKELEACLNYKNLLPHLYGTRGIKKVCVFNKHFDLVKAPPEGKTKLIAVTFPEGVRERETRVVHKKIMENKDKN